MYFVTLFFLLLVSCMSMIVLLFIRFPLGILINVLICDLFEFFVCVSVSLFALHQSERLLQTVASRECVIHMTHADAHKIITLLNKHFAKLVRVICFLSQSFSMLLLHRFLLFLCNFFFFFAFFVCV